MNSFTLLEKLLKIDSSVLCNQDQPYRSMMDDLINSVKLEIQSAELPRETVNIAKAAKKFSELCFRENSEKRDGIAGANLYHDNDDPDPSIMRQYITDGFVFVSYSRPFDAVVRATGEPIDANQILKYRNCGTCEPVLLPMLAKLKKVVKTEAASRSAKQRRNIILHSSGKIFNIHYLIRMMELCGFTGGETVFNCGNLHSPLFGSVETSDGNKIKCLLLPISQKSNVPENILIRWSEVDEQ